MAGIDPQAAGLRSFDIIFCQLSPLHTITLDLEAKIAAGIPSDATFFAWAYPVVEDVGSPIRFREDASGAFMRYGGFLYFDRDSSVVGANGIAPAPPGSRGLVFSWPQPLPDNVTECLTLQGRFQEVTLDVLVSKGATHFAWIRPNEFQDQLASANGAFAYKFSMGGHRYFPVTDKPVCNPELLEEELESTEAWVIIRNAQTTPSLEVLQIFDRTLTFEENAHNNENSNQVEIESVRDLSVQRGDDPPMSYAQWMLASGCGSPAQPWIITLLR
jgi:hypothetical protein